MSARPKSSNSNRSTHHQHRQHANSHAVVPHTASQFSQPHHVVVPRGNAHYLDSQYAPCSYATHVPQYAPYASGSGYYGAPIAHTAANMQNAAMMPSAHVGHTAAFSDTLRSINEWQPFQFDGTSFTNNTRASMWNAAVAGGVAGAGTMLGGALYHAAGGATHNGTPYPHVHDT